MPHVDIEKVLFVVQILCILEFVVPLKLEPFISITEQFLNGFWQQFIPYIHAVLN